MAASTHPDDSSLLPDRDTRRAQAVQADQQAAIAEADDDLERTAALRQEAAEHVRAAESAQRQLSTNQERRRAALANTVVAHHWAAAIDSSTSR